MNKRQILKYNKAIAVFMGWKIISSKQLCNKNEVTEAMLQTSPMFAYHESWDLLMGVCDKLGDSGFLLDLDFRERLVAMWPYHDHVKGKEKTIHVLWRLVYKVITEGINSRKKIWTK